MASNGKFTAYDAAVAAAATQAEKDRLRDLRLHFNTPPDSPEWQFYAVLAPLLATQPDREDITAQLTRLESRVQTLHNTKQSVPSVSEPTSILIVVVLTMLLCIAVAVVTGVGQLTFVALIAAFAIGVCVALAYVWVAPMITRKK